MRRRLFLAIAAGLIPGLRGQNPSSGQNGAPTEQDPVAPPKAQTPAELFPLTRDEEKLLPAFKHFTHSKEQFVPFAFKDPIAKGVALVGAGFNLHATETIHPAKYEYNNRKRKDPSAETLWKVSGVPENLEELRTNAVSNTRARAYLYLKKAGKDPVIQKKAAISKDSAETLFDLSLRQAMYNASCYFKHWKSFTAYQKIAFSDMVYQMGPNFEGFSQMLGKANQEKPLTPKDWSTVQTLAKGGKWHNNYPDRAPFVVAMMGANYRAPKEMRDLIPKELLPPEQPAYVQAKRNSAPKPHHPRINPNTGTGRSRGGKPSRQVRPHKLVEGDLDLLKNDED